MKRKLALILSALMLFVLLPQAALAEVTITGTPTAGETLTVSAAGTDTVQWYASETEDGTYTAIPNATAAELIVPRTVMGHYVKAGIKPEVGTEAFSAPVRVRGEINEIVNLSFDSAADLAAFTMTEGVTASVANGIASFKGEITGVNMAATAGAFQGTIAPDVYVAEARVMYDVANEGTKGGMRIYVADSARYKYCAMYSTDSSSNNARYLIYKPAAASSTNEGNIKNTGAGNKDGQYVTVRVMTDLTNQRIYVSCDGALVSEIDCKDAGRELADGLKYNIEIVGGATYVDYIRFYGLNDATDGSAQNVKIRGIAAVGRSIRLEYTYNSLSDKAEGTSEYKWYMADTAAGPFTDAQLIKGITASTLPLGIRQSGKWVKGVVIPKDADGIAGRGAETAAIYVTPAAETGATTYNYNTVNEVEEHFNLPENSQNALAVTEVAEGNYAATVTPADGTTLGRTEYVATSDDYEIDSTADIIVLEMSARYLNIGNGGGVKIDFGTAAGYGDANFHYLRQADGTQTAAKNGQIYLDQNTDYQRTAKAPVSPEMATTEYVKFEYVINRAQGIVDVFVNDVYKDEWRKGTFNSTDIVNAPLSASDLMMNLDKGGYKCRVRIRGNAAVDYFKIRTYKTPDTVPSIDVMSAAFIAGEDGAKAVTDTLAPGTPLGGRIHAINYGAEAKGITIVMAAYEGGRITDLVMETVMVPAMNGWHDVDLTETLTVTADTTRTAIFAWEGMGIMKPLIRANNLYRN